MQTYKAAEYDEKQSNNNKLKAEFKEDMKNFNVLYLFSFKDIRTRVMREVVDSKEWHGSKIIFGKNKVIIGAVQSLMTKNMHWPDLANLIKLIKGQVGVLFTNRPQWEILDWFNTFSVWDYPQPGYEVSETIKLECGPLPLFQPEIEPYLRQLGMQTMMLNGVVFLKEPFLVCKAGSILTKRQVNILELLGEKLSVYRLKLKAVWTKGGGLEVLANEDDSDGEKH